MKSTVENFIASGLIILTLITFCSKTLQAAAVQDNYVINIISSNQGLPADDVKAIFQDSKGFLWFCTTEGLIRYDGYVLKTFSIALHHNKGLITNSFNAIDEDSEGFLWCATDRGVARLDREMETFTFFNIQTQAPYALSYDVINTLAVDQQNHIWIGSSGSGVEVLDPEKGIIARYSTSDSSTGMNSDWITHIVRDNLNNIWICSWQGALTLVDQTHNFIKSWTKSDIPLKLSHFSPFSMTQDADNDYWLGLWGEGIIYFSLEGDSLIVKKHLKLSQRGLIEASNIIFDLTFDQDSNLWVGSAAGLLRIEEPKHSDAAFIQFNTESRDHRISHNEAYTILCDASGLIWLGTSGGGINKIDNKIKVFKTSYINNDSEQLSSQSVTAFTKTPDDDLLIGVKSLGFGKYNTKNQSFERYSELPGFKQLSNDINTVNCFLWDTKGFLWLGTRYLGIIKVNPKTGKYLIINKTATQYNFPSREIYDIQEDARGHIWVGTENGLYKIIASDPANFNNFIILRYASEEGNYESLSSNRISKILIDHNQHLWIATFDGGVNLSTSDIKNHYPLLFERFQAAQKESNNLITDHILTLFEDTSHNLWVGSGGGGLFKWEPKQKKFSSYSSSVAGDIIYAINQDDQNNLWIGTNRGLTKMNFSSKQIRSNYFLRENGLQGNIFNKGASFKDNQGALCFGGNNGFNYFNPIDLKPNSFIPPVVITDVKIMNKPVTITTSYEHPLVLNHLKNNFSVTFAALSYSQPENNKYAVRLEGLEDDWRIIDANMRFLNYANLKPGRYTLKIKGSNSQGQWNQTPEQLFIKVNPAPYKTWWAFSIYFFIFGAFIFMIFRIEKKSQKVKQDLEIEHIERQKSDKLNLFKQGLFANISHEFLTPLNILACLVDTWRDARKAPYSKDLTLAERNINRLNRLNRQFLYYGQSEVKQLTLFVSAENLNNFTQNICDNFIPLARKNQITFNCEIKCPESNLWFDQEKLDIILYNLLSNAFKFTPEGGTISIDLNLSKSKSQTLAHFSIKDTGKGIEPEQLAKIFDRYHSVDRNYQKTGGFGIGLALTKSMIETHKGTIDLKSESGKGTSVSFSIPVNKNAFDKSEMAENKQNQIPITLLKPDDGDEEEVILRIKNLQQSSEDKPVILIVEDNADFRELLKSSLKPLFSVIEAPNGIIGYETARNKKPNIIITDVIMPSMNGIELCRKIKKNETTSHINVILLTAKISDEERAKGYRAGADSYITKPFSMNILLARIEALLEQQKTNTARLKDYNHNENKKQNDFMASARQIIEKNLSNPDFSVKTLAGELSISNSMLYRKTSELLNINPNTFIRKIKMMKAAEMLEENNLSISEVAFKCGFKDVSYFGTSFKKNYGLTPTQYQKKNNIS